MNFLRALKSKQNNGDEEIVECLSPVLSLGGGSGETGTYNGTYDDDAYVNHYYDFGEDESEGEDDFDEEYFYDDHHDQQDDDSFIMTIQALSKDEATMSYLKMALDVAEENNLDLNYSQLTDPVFEARNELSRARRAANERRTMAPKASKKKKSQPVVQRGRKDQKQHRQEVDQSIDE
eukprot:jgi/Psemu1/304543/fgenesh1_kg.158_\